jgi:hypothetical protein
MGEIKAIFNKTQHVYCIDNFQSDFRGILLCEKIEDSADNFFDDKKIVPSVSQILAAVEKDGEKLIDLSAIPEHILQRACDIGSAVPYAIELQRELDRDTLPDEILQQYKAYEKFMLENNIAELLTVEQPVIYCGDDGYFGGTIDAFAYMTTDKKELCIIDWKSGSVITESNKIQQGGYLKLFPNINVAVMVKLKKDADYELI